MRPTIRSSLAGLLATAVAASAALFATGQPAAAGWQSVNLPRLSWTYLDSASPKAKFVDATVPPPVGTIADAAGKSHTYRSYFTFDLSGLKGQVVHSSYLYTYEDHVTDCTKAATVELWRTAPVRDNTSWKNSPKELERLFAAEVGSGSWSCPSYLGRDMVDQLNAAIARGDKTVTFEYRVAAAQETDVHLGRTIQAPTLSSTSNHPPVVSNPRLRYPDRPCGTPQKPSPARASDALTVDKADADGDFVSVSVATWPIDHPEQRKERGIAYDSVDLSDYADGTVVAWQAHGYDYTDYGPWSKTCYIRIDKQGPATPPVVASKLYPTGAVATGGQGIKGRFRLDAAGEADVAAFVWRDWQGLSGRVDARQGRAVMEYTPTRSGPQSLSVQSIDSAGNYGATTEYRFWVASTAPEATVDVAGVGLPSTITLYGSAATFGYQVQGGSETRVPNASGTGATGQIVFPATGYVKVFLRSYNAAGKLLGEKSIDVQVSDAPDVSSAEFNLERDALAGETGTFTFKPRSAGVVGYAYDFGSGEQRIAAGADGVATLRWTADPPGWTYLTVRSIGAGGALSQENYYQFNIIDPKPQIWAQELQTTTRTDAPGKPLELRLSSQMTDVTGFVYTFNGGTEQTVTGPWYGTVVSVTPRLGDNTVVAQALLPGGGRSPAATFTWQPYEAPLISTDPSPGAMGHPVTVKLTSVRPGPKEFHYSVNGGPSETVAAAADGTASFTYIPSDSTSLSIRATSVAADGTESPERSFYTNLRLTGVEVYSSYSEYWTTGGLGVPGTVTFRTEYVPETVEYVYTLNGGAEVVAPAVSDGFGTTVTIVPDRTGLNVLVVRGRTAAGELSSPREFRFQVGTLPFVASTEFPIGVWSGAVGVEGHFTAGGGMEGVTSFDFTFDDAQPVTVPVDSQGRATTTYTPATGGVHRLTVIGHTAAGTATEIRYYDILVNS
ncbi:hypothetical protein ACQP00_46990 [Dactylosporangium sp. CS-047395]|uniref:hypothetical protein n=1 Tax=Dactylosporangium sp. CS-047395 TaxID=3239936 RepID=UPI003D8F8901